MDHPRHIAGDPRYPPFPPEVPVPGAPPPWPPGTPPVPPVPGPGTPPVPSVPVPGPEPSTGDDWRERVYGDLLARRVVMLDGPLDTQRTALVAAEVMALDGDATDPITLVVNSPGGPLDAAAAVLDAIDLVASPIETTCLGQATGTAAVVLAAGTGRRRAGPSSLIRLRLPDTALDGPAAHLAEEAAHLARLHAALIDRLARATGQERRLVDRDVGAGRALTADEAVRYGLVDEVTRRPP